MKIRFPTEEQNLMCLFDTSNLEALRSDLLNALEYVYQPDIFELFWRVIGKLDMLTDEEFAGIEFRLVDDSVLWNHPRYVNQI
ncbi:MAG: transposon-transfer assisting family protein [Defluviitaleaceae bacterium]|nr:transposon-transfer assisting family protein [Defluviitaleaceae bacterium]